MRVYAEDIQGASLLGFSFAAMGKFKEKNAVMLSANESSS